MATWWVWDWEIGNGKVRRREGLGTATEMICFGLLELLVWVGAL